MQYISIQILIFHLMVNCIRKICSDVILTLHDKVGEISIKISMFGES